MNSQDYQAMMNAKPYNGLQLVHMTYDEAYDFAGDYGMNAIITTIRPPYSMSMVRLWQTDDHKLEYNGVELDKEIFDIYWIGRND